MIIAVSALAVLVLMLGMFLSQAGDKDDAEKVSLDTVTVAAYDMSYLPYDGNDPRYYEDEKPISEYKTGDFKLKIVKGQEEILYITLEDFAALYKNDWTAITESSQATARLPSGRSRTRTARTYTTCRPTPSPWF